MKIKNNNINNKRGILYGVLLVSAMMVLTGCEKKEDQPILEEQTEAEQIIVEEDPDTGVTVEYVEEKKTEASAENTVDDRSEEILMRAQEILADMTTEEKVYQMFVLMADQLTGIDAVTQAGETTKACLEQYPVGGIIYMGNNIVDREQILSMLEDTKEYSKIPLFTAVDEEGGTVARISNNEEMGYEKISDMIEIGNTGDTQNAYNIGQTLGNECSELGFNLDFAPIADVWSNSENIIISNRAFGTDADTVAEMVAACVEGFKSTNTLCTLKHFPGHGDTNTDSHYEAASTAKTLDELRELEFKPFKSGIDAGADFVMVGHILTPNITADSLPATLSPQMISILRDELDFDGIIITDAMNMAAITDYYSSDEAAVKAIQAGVDMILAPADFHVAAEGVMNAIENGQIDLQTIDESVTRILCTKLENIW